MAQTVCAIIALAQFLWQTCIGLQVQSAEGGGLFSDPQDKRINQTGGLKKWTGGLNSPNPPQQFPHWFAAVSLSRRRDKFISTGNRNNQKFYGRGPLDPHTPLPLGTAELKISTSEYLRCASKCAITRLNHQKFSGEGAQPCAPSADPSSGREGDTPSRIPLPLGAVGSSMPPPPN